MQLLHGMQFATQNVFVNTARQSRQQACSRLARQQGSETIIPPSNRAVICRAPLGLKFKRNWAILLLSCAVLLDWPTLLDAEQRMPPNGTHFLAPRRDIRATAAADQR